MASTPAPSTPSLAELETMAAAPDLTKRERRELGQLIRRRRRIATWESRLAAPQPRKLHRAVITLAMMAVTLWVLWLLLSGSTG